MSGAFKYHFWIDNWYSNLADGTGGGRNDPSYRNGGRSTAEVPRNFSAFKTDGMYVKNTGRLICIQNCKSISLIASECPKGHFECQED